MWEPTSTAPSGCNPSSLSGYSRTRSTYSGGPNIFYPFWPNDQFGWY